MRILFDGRSNTYVYIQGWREKEVGGRIWPVGILEKFRIIMIIMHLIFLELKKLCNFHIIVNNLI